MVLQKVTLLLLLTVSNLFIAADAFSWSDCGLKDAVVSFKNLTVKPDPIKFASPLTFGGQIKLDKDLIPGSRSHLFVWRVVKLFWTWPIDVRVGCISGYGTCSRDLCDRLRKSDVLCQYLKKANASCDCPLKRGTYESLDNKIDMPGSLAVSLLASGRYKFRWLWVDPTGKEMGCLKGELEFD